MSDSTARPEAEADAEADTAADTEADTADTAAAVAPRRGPIYREILYIAAVYLVYSTVRNHFGSAGGTPGHANGIAYGHALDVIDLERNLRLFFEQSLQSWYLALPAHGLIQVWNVFYGTAHFVITAGALIWLFFRDPARYPRWRNTLAFTTLLALVGFAVFSLMPPRLLDKPPEQFGPPASASNEHFGFVDTLEVYPTFWSFDSGGLKKLSNQYAAMPSLHTAWATWSMLVLFPLVRRRWLRVLIVLDPIATLFCIIVTANHYWVDAAFGVVTLALGYLIASRVTNWWEARHARDGRDTRSERRAARPRRAIA
ncbi:MAG TPA: phosphatase PAP2 family protein [Acidimicrobiales bacterium]